MSDTAIVSFFRTLPFFAGLPDAQVEMLAKRARTQGFAAGQTIIGADQTVRAFHILAEGRAKLCTTAPDGKEQTIYVFAAGEPFCLCWAFDENRFPASVEALEDSRVHVIAQAALEDAAREAPGILFNIVLLLSHRLKQAMERILSLSTRDSGQRLALFLLGLRAQAPDAERLRLPITHRELAKLLGLTPEALSRTFRRLVAAGLVRVNGRDVVFTARERLEGYALLGRGEG